MFIDIRRLQHESTNHMRPSNAQFQMNIKCNVTYSKQTEQKKKHVIIGKVA